MRLHVLSWNEPLPASAARWLAEGWSGRAVLDLAHWCVVVPTRQSGRRLREALAALAAEQGQAVFPPRVILPEGLASMGAPTAGVANRAEQQLAWIDVLQTLDLAAFREVFPVDPPARSFTWARGLASQLMRLQATLAESGLRVAGVRERAVADQGGFPEAARWLQLAELERRVDHVLASRGLRSVEATVLETAAAPVLPAHLTHLALVGTPDPSTLCLQALAFLATRREVRVVVHGPAEGDDVAAAFDAWGRPRTDVWTQRCLDWGTFEEQVHLHADPASQARHVVEMARAYGAPEGRLGVGVADSDVLGALEPALARHGLRAFNPAGRPRRAEGLHALLSALAELARAPSWSACATVLRCPDVLAWLADALPATAAPERLLAEVDALGEQHLPPDLTAALVQAAAHPRRFGTVKPALQALHELRRRLVGGTFPANAAAVLQDLFARRRLDTGSELFAAAEVWTETLREAGRALASSARAERTLADAWEFALTLYGERPRFDDKPPGAVELNGWIELLWEDAPHVVVAGLNDGRVPETVMGDVFLPESLRARIGMRTNADRFARDAYLLQALAAARTSAGRLDVLVGKVSSEGDPLRPSRLLLRCPDAELPRRVAWLFREVDAPQASLPWTRAWRLQPRLAPPPTRVSVTSLRAWLTCPFRFYLRHVLRMERVEPGKSELDARDFGTLLHAALQHLTDETVRDCVDVSALQAFLLARFDEAARARYGELLTLPLMIQFQSARQRLRKTAEIQARIRTDGWRIDRVEWPFELALSGLTVRGTIDRVDRRVDDPTCVRVLDYKTSDTPATAPEAHLRSARDDDATRPAWQRVRIDGKERVWIDLQLPLYRRAMAAEFGAKVQCGYINLPKAAGEAALEVWEALTPDLQASAERCAEGAAAAIVAGEFWPPAEVDRDRDDWAELFHQGCADSIDAGRAAELSARNAGTNPGGAS